jgi:voltage-gated sodium channel
MSDTTAPVGVRQRLAAWLDSAPVRNTIIGVIVFNAIILGMETSDTLMATAGPLILALDRACLAIFVVEIALKLVALGGRFFRSGWNLFDFVIVGIALVPGGRACRCCGRCASSGSCASCRWSRRCAAWWRG